MAKRTATRTIVMAPRQAAPVIRIATPQVRSVARRAGRAVRRYGGAVGRAAAGEKHTLTAMLAAGGLGLVEKSGVAIPTIGPLGPAATLGVAAWLYGRHSKSQTAQHVATGLLCVAVNRWAATGTIAGEGHGAVFDDDE